MKKALSGILATTVIFASCTSLQPIVGESKYSQESVEVIQNGYLVTWTPIYIMLEWQSVKGLQVELQNKSGNTIEINWSESSIAYKGQTYGLFISGQKYVDAGKAVPNLTIPPNGRVNKDIYPSDNVSWAGNAGWRISAMPIGKKDKVTLTIAIESEGKTQFITGESTSRIGTGFGIWFF